VSASFAGTLHHEFAIRTRMVVARPSTRLQRIARQGGFLMLTFAVSRVALDAGGRVTHVFWGRVDPQENTWATPEVLAPVVAAVNALDAGDQVFALFPSTHGHLPERRFMVADYDGGLKTIVMEGPATREREIHDMDRIDL